MIDMSLIWEIVAIIFFIGLFIFHALPFIISIRIVRLLQGKRFSFFISIFWSFISFTPLGLFTYFIYYAMTCGAGGCFSGLFFLLSAFPAFILLGISALIIDKIDNPNKRK